MSHRGRGPGRGGRGYHGAIGRRPRDCLDYKLLGKCERNDAGECWFSHTNKESNPPRETVMIPDKIPMTTAVSKTFIKLLRNISECRLKPASSNSIEIVVSESDASHLPRLKKEYEIFVSQLYPIGPGWCYIHRDGVEKCETGSLLKFRYYEGRVPLKLGIPFVWQTLLELCIADEAEKSDGASKAKAEVINPPRETETREGLHKAIDRAHGGKEHADPKHKKDIGVKIINDHEDHMKEMLTGGLEWFCEEKRGRGPFVLKLEGRFGKILWKNIPEDVQERTFGIEQFANLCFNDTKHSIIFTTDVKQENAGAVKHELYEGRISLLETFDIKFTIPNSRERSAIDVRVKFEGGRPKLLFAKKNEAKIVVFNVLCLHRQHDIRISLNYYEMMNTDSTEYPLVEQLMKTLSLSDPNEGIISLLARTQDWNVNFIRHKKRESYRIDDKHMVTVTDIRDCQLKDQQQDELVSINSDLYNKNHTELEFHNCLWEYAFGRDVGLSPDKYLALHMENPAVLSEIASASPDPWQPENILMDFQEFCGNLDLINEMLGPNSI